MEVGDQILPGPGPTLSVMSKTNITYIFLLLECGSRGFQMVVVGGRGVGMQIY